MYIKRKYRDLELYVEQNSMSFELLKRFFILMILISIVLIVQFVELNY